MLTKDGKQFFIDDKEVSYQEAVDELIKIFSEVGSSGEGLPEDELRHLNSYFFDLMPITRTYDEDTALDTLDRCITGLNGCKHGLSARYLSRILFTMAEELVKRDDCYGIAKMIEFCKDGLFRIMLHERDVYYNIAFAFYMIFKQHEQIEGKGFFDAVKYINRYRGYNGNDADFIVMAKYFAERGHQSKKTPLNVHNYYGALLEISKGYLKITENIPGRYPASAVINPYYKLCNETVTLEDEESQTYRLWSGAAYMLSLYAGNYEDRLDIAKLYDAEKLCVPTDTDLDKRHQMRKGGITALLLTVLGLYIFVSIISKLSTFGIICLILVSAFVFISIKIPDEYISRDPGPTVIYVNDPLWYYYGPFSW